MAKDYMPPERVVVRLTPEEFLGRDPVDEELEEEFDGPGLHSDVPHELAQVIIEAYGEENLQRLADAALRTAVKEMVPNPDYADVQAKALAMDALRLALGINELPIEERE